VARLAVGTARQQRLPVTGRRRVRRASGAVRNRLVQLPRRCQNCEMLRYLDVRRILAPLLAGAALACGSAAPIDVGTDIAPAEPEPPAAGPDGQVDNEEPLVGQMDSMPGGVDGLVDSDWERGEVSPYCRSSFQACGGLLAGTWEVEDNCNPEIRTREVLARWGLNTMRLNPVACYTAVQRLLWTWSGQFSFQSISSENGIAIDDRMREQRVDIELDSDCLNASFDDLHEGQGVSQEACDSMQNASTTCALASGVCLCTNRTASNGFASGQYRVLGVSAEIAQTPLTRYEYCVDGDRLLWQEKEGAQRQVVLKRVVAPPPGTTDPVEIPR
jgi:hypothetical protein